MIIFIILLIIIILISRIINHDLNTKLHKNTNNLREFAGRETSVIMAQAR